jgi:hypothetical protein
MNHYKFWSQTTKLTQPSPSTRYIPHLSGRTWYFSPRRDGGCPLQPWVHAAKAGILDSKLPNLFIPAHKQNRTQQNFPNRFKMLYLLLERSASDVYRLAVFELPKTTRKSFILIWVRWELYPPERESKSQQETQQRAERGFCILGCHIFQLRSSYLAVVGQGKRFISDSPFPTSLGYIQLPIPDIARDSSSSEACSRQLPPTWIELLNGFHFWRWRLELQSIPSDFHATSQSSSKNLFWVAHNKLIPLPQIFRHLAVSPETHQHDDVHPPGDYIATTWSWECQEGSIRWFFSGMW